MFLTKLSQEKDRRNIRRHGVDFALARRIFDGPVVTGIDDRKDYGEVHEVSLGLVDSVLLGVVHTARDEATRLIFARRANGRERSRHDEAFRQGHDP